MKNLQVSKNYLQDYINDSYLKRKKLKSIINSNKLDHWELDRLMSEE